METPTPDGDVAEWRALADRLAALRANMLADEHRFAPRLRAVDARHRASARNLVHYLALRRHDLRSLQDALARQGLSSLGRAEADVLPALERVLAVLHRLLGEPALASGASMGGRQQLAAHADALFGPAPDGRAVRIMVTLPDEAAHDDALVAALVARGMDVARINAAHGDAAAWTAMATHVRQAAAAAGRHVRIQFDLAGPKLRTGALPPGPAVLKLKPQRDAWGRVQAPARVVLVAEGDTPSPEADSVQVDADWCAALRAGDAIDLVDARGAQRHWSVVAADGRRAVAECTHTTYLAPGVRLLHPGPRGVQTTGVGGLPPAAGALELVPGDLLRVCRDADAALHPGGALRIGCTLPEVFAQVRAGERAWFDDGRIGGVIEATDADGFDVRITRTRDGGALLRADKGINLPDSRLALPALTAKDRADLDVAVRIADLVALSFAQDADDVAALRATLAERGASHLGLVLKIETRRGFEQLPELLLAALAHPAAGVMIARGDLAVECGWERLAEVQEEILWAAEAARVPVIWATQVLESLAKGGAPSRAEITDAAMGVRAECVMLNKGPHLVEAIATLDDILVRMQSHQTKKRSLLRALRAWAEPAAATP
ncbi:pyruvate kinase [Azohydromonas sediminis]|uniref:pyruvate kinase n=1 Tax=Azohydromonas sediminis TaxID=2259674 RepID=UPI000E651A7A|nr:pyruvate kinase [Azohydromonas sediminis]